MCVCEIEYFILSVVDISRRSVYSGQQRSIWLMAKRDGRLVNLKFGARLVKSMHVQKWGIFNFEGCLLVYMYVYLLFSLITNYQKGLIVKVDFSVSDHKVSSVVFFVLF